MELANAMLNIGNDGSAIVFKENLTPAEVAVLRVIHGDDAVTDIDILEADAQNEFGKPRTHRQELARLNEIYGRNLPEGGRSAPAVERLFPGAAARVFESFEELELDESLFKATERAIEKPSKQVSAPKSEPVASKKPVAPVETAPVDDLSTKTIPQLKTLADEENIDLDGATKKADIIAKIEAARASNDPIDPIDPIDQEEFDGAEADEADEDDSIEDMEPVQGSTSVFE
jgi:hypothetical protein